MSKICGAREFETTFPWELPNDEVSLGNDHYPVGHRTSALGMQAAILDTGLEIISQQHVVDGARGADGRTGNYGDIVISGANLFSLFTVRHPAFGGDGEALIGYRNSVAQRFAASACIGVSFPVCTNVSLFGHDIIFNRKNTRYANLPELMKREVGDKVLPMLATVQEQLDRLARRTIDSTEKRAIAWDAFACKVLPANKLGAVNDLLNDCSEAPEVKANNGNMLGLMHTFTRVVRDMPIRPQAEKSQAISRYFGFGQKLAA
jgi:hypothetical protein